MHRLCESFWNKLVALVALHILTRTQADWGDLMWWGCVVWSPLFFDYSHSQVSGTEACVLAALCTSAEAQLLRDNRIVSFNIITASHSDADLYTFFLICLFFFFNNML